MWVVFSKIFRGISEVNFELIVKGALRGIPETDAWGIPKRFLPGISQIILEKISEGILKKKTEQITGGISKIII